MKRYHFSLGNSTEGPIGYCAAVHAKTRGQAVGLLKEALENLNECANAVDEEGGVEYVEVYFNVAHVVGAAIDDVDESNREEVD
jgi:hypothetical protein